MYRLRLHGRGGQGVKTAGRILGSAFFAAGFEVQDAPRYGAERRGAPLFAYVRADRGPIRERGVIRRPDLVVVADPSLLAGAAGPVLEGVDAGCVLAIASDEPAAVWEERLRCGAPVASFPAGAEEHAGAAAAGAAARLVGVLSAEVLDAALERELAPLGADALAASRAAARRAWDALGERAGCVREGAPLAPGAPPQWVEVPFDAAARAAPDVHAAATSAAVRTGLWRSMRPVLEPERCRGCHWMCATLCPDGAITPDAEGRPQIDLDHCKGCLVCVAVCPTHALHAVPERSAEPLP